MAKAQFGAGLIDMRNKVNGWVFAGTQYGTIIKKKVSPNNPQSLEQQRRRQQTAYLSRKYSRLTTAQQNQWKEAAKEYHQPDEFGRPYSLSANMLFITLNANLQSAGQAIIVSPVPFQPLPDLFITALVPSATNQTLTIWTNLFQVPPGYTLLTYSTGNLSRGRNNFSGALRLLGTNTIVNNHYDAISSFTPRFGQLINNLRLQAGIRLINNATGQATRIAKENSLIF